MKQKYSWLITVSAILLAGALISCESDAVLGSEGSDDSYSSSRTSQSSSSVIATGKSSSSSVIATGKSSSSSVITTGKSSSSSVITTGKSSSSSVIATGKSSSSSVVATGKSSSSSAKIVYCDFGDGDCYSDFTASTCGSYGGEVVSVCPAVGSSSSASAATGSCYNADAGVCGQGIAADDCNGEGDAVVAACPSNYINSCQTAGFMLYEYANAEITCEQLEELGGLE